MSGQEGDREELALIRRVADGDREAFAMIVGRHQDAVWRVVRLLSPSDAAAEDALQETFLAAYRSAKSFRAESSLRTWLLAIARRRALRLSERRAGEPGEMESDWDLGVAAGWGEPDPDPEEEASRVEQRAALTEALASLSEEDRTVIVLRDIEGMTGPEAARALGIPLATLKTRLHRARLRLVAAMR